jgi:hypothetical protein
VVWLGTAGLPPDQIGKGYRFEILLGIECTRGQFQAVRLPISAHPGQIADHRNDHPHRPSAGPEVL